MSFVYLQDRQDLRVEMVFQDRPVRLDPQDLQAILVYQVVQVVKAGQEPQEGRVFQDQQDQPDFLVLQVEFRNLIYL